MAINQTHQNTSEESSRGIRQQVLSTSFLIPLIAFAGGMLILVGLFEPTSCSDEWGTCLSQLGSNSFVTQDFEDFRTTYVFQSDYAFLIVGGLSTVFFATWLRSRLAMQLAVGITIYVIVLLFIQSLILMDKGFMRGYEDNPLVLSGFAGGWWYLLIGAGLLILSSLIQPRQNVFYTEVYKDQSDKNEPPKTILSAIRMATFGIILVGAGGLNILTLGDLDHDIRGILLSNPIGVTILGLTVGDGIALSLRKSSGINLMGMSGVIIFITMYMAIRTRGVQFSFGSPFGIGLLALLGGSILVTMAGSILWIAVYGEQSVAHEEKKRGS